MMLRYYPGNNKGWWEDKNAKSDLPELSVGMLFTSAWYKKPAGMHKRDPFFHKFATRDNIAPTFLLFAFIEEH